MAEPFAGMTDFLFGYDTDIHFENGDIKTTSGLDYLEREIYKLLISEPRDWKASPDLGASLTRFVGLQNSREVGSSIKRHIERSLGPTVFPAQTMVRVIPINETTIMVLIDIYIEGYIATRFPFQFDFVSGFKKVTLRDAEVVERKSSNQYQINDISHTTTPNKYYERQRYQR